MLPRANDRARQIWCFAERRLPAEDNGLEHTRNPSPVTPRPVPSRIAAAIPVTVHADIIARPVTRAPVRESAVRRRVIAPAVAIDVDARVAPPIPAIRAITTLPAATVAVLRIGVGVVPAVPVPYLITARSPRTVLRRCGSCNDQRKRQEHDWSIE